MIFTALKYFTRLVEKTISLPIKMVRFFLYAVVFNPRLGPLRYIAALAMIYVALAIGLVYVFAPLRGLSGEIWLANKLNYDAERWMATGIDL